MALRGGLGSAWCCGAMLYTFALLFPDSCRDVAEIRRWWDATLHVSLLQLDRRHEVQLFFFVVDTALVVTRRLS